MIPAKKSSMSCRPDPAQAPPVLLQVDLLQPLKVGFLDDLAQFRLVVLLNLVDLLPITPRDLLPSELLVRNGELLLH